MNLLFMAILVCIPLIALAWSLPEKWQMFPVVISTALFIGYVSPVSLFILFSTTVITYYTLKNYKSQPAATLIIIMLVGSILLFYKLQPVLHFSNTINWIFPLGLSYYSFRQIHYAIEEYKKKLPAHSISDYFIYLFFLPTMLVGPINLFQPFLKDLRKRRWDSLLFSSGLERILYGLIKVCVIGNYLLSYRFNLFCNTIAVKYEWLITYLQIFKFTANAYFQFAGYSDIAIGLSMLFGFKIIENFNYPFLSPNIAEFWKRWHISLSSWCREYVFYPFLGITRNAIISITLSMIVLGIWHEVSLRYLLWGFVHAIAISLWHKYEASWLHKKIAIFPLFQQIAGIIITINFVMLSFVLISENSLYDSLKLLRILLFLN